MNIKRALMLLSIVLVVVLFFRESLPVTAADEWLAEYWNNDALEGTPVLSRTETGLDNDWGIDSPDDLINADNFSARWTTETKFDAGTYRFTAAADDGLRLYVDGKKIIDVWSNSQQHNIAVDRYLSGGTHKIVVEYYEDKGDATARLSWAQVGGPAEKKAAWTAEYFNNIDLSGEPVVVRQEEQIDYRWRDSPVSGIERDNFSVRWTSTIVVEGGVYRFTMAGDDGVRLWLNGKPIIDRWVEQPETSYSADVTLPPGSLTVRMEQYDRGGNAAAKLQWSKLSSITLTDESEATSQTFSKWKGEYFNNMDLAGEPALVRSDEEINFNWGSSSPLPVLINRDEFSARWTQTFTLPAQRYQFELSSDDGARLYINDQLIVDQWRAKAGLTEGQFKTEGGETEIRIEFFEMSQNSRIRFQFSEIDSSEESSAQKLSKQKVDTREAPEGSAILKNARVLTVRSGPGIRFEQIDYIVDDTTVELIGRSRGGFWVKVRLPNGTIGWASTKYLSSPTPFSSLAVTE